jgi:hypothetical protein
MSSRVFHRREFVATTKVVKKRYDDRALPREEWRSVIDDL